VIRNTFLELSGDSTALSPCLVRRRAASDVTDHCTGRPRTFSGSSEKCSMEQQGNTPAVSSSIASAAAAAAGGISHPPSAMKRMGTCDTLEAVVECESDTEVPDEEEDEFEKSYGVDEEDGLHMTATGSEMGPRSSTTSWSMSGTLSGPLSLAFESSLGELDEPSSPAEVGRGDSTSLTRTRTSSTLFWGASDIDMDDLGWVDAVPEVVVEPQQPPSAPPRHLTPAYLEVVDAGFAPAAPSSARSSIAQASQSTDLEEGSTQGLDGGKKRKSRRRGHRHNVWQTTSSEDGTGVEPTTVMLRNLPNRYTRKMFLRMLDAHGFRGFYNFIYLPIDFRHKVNLGYAFVNTVSHESAVRLKDALNGFNSWAFDSLKVCEAVWASPHQGLEENMERYRNSPVMHESVPDEFKPVLFQDGMRISFPLPTKNIRSPKVRPVASGFTDS